MANWRKVLGWAEEPEEEYTNDIVPASKVKPGMIGEDSNDQRWQVIEIFPARDYFDYMPEGEYQKLSTPVNLAVDWIVKVKSLDSEEEEYFLYVTDASFANGDFAVYE